MEETKTRKAPEILKAKYAVTFEFMTRAPVTIRGEVEGWKLQTLMVKAIKEARVQAKKPESIAKYGTIIGWSSISVLLDRYDFLSKDSESKDSKDSDSKEEV